jgi:hypothetical protein
MFLVSGIILGIIGLVMLIKPSIIWLITEKWKSRDVTEPSNLYVWSIRFGAICLIVVAILCFYALSL